ncbi:MAG: HD-GYP domain-containing protein, partial [Methylomonas sp.]
LEWDEAEAHCIRGAAYLSACQPLAHLSAEIRYHHTRWEKLLELPVDDRIRLRANLLFLADRIDVLQAPFLTNGMVLTEYPGIIARIKTLSGTLFSPQLVDAFVHIGNVEAFWLAMEPEYLDEDLRSMGSNLPPLMLGIAELKELARLFSRVVDAKTHYTDEHSQRVAQIARQLASEFGVEDYDLDQVEIAGLLHDVGKLRVSEDIIEKPGSLTPTERAAMHRHSYDTFRILQRVFGDSKIPMWAGFHHETLNGEGYPFKTNNQGLDLECRIIAVADIFQALAQKRPYRSTMSLKYILDNLQSRVAAGQLDGKVVAKLIENAEDYYRLAVA